MGWLYEFMGVLLGAAVCPVALCIMSTRANKWGCISGAWIGMICGITVWLSITSSLFGALTIDVSRIPELKFSRTITNSVLNSLPSTITQ